LVSIMKSDRLTALITQFSIQCRGRWRKGLSLNGTSRCLKMNDTNDIVSRNSAKDSSKCAFVFYGTSPALFGSIVPLSAPCREVASIRASVSRRIAFLVEIASRRSEQTTSTNNLRRRAGNIASRRRLLLGSSNPGWQEISRHRTERM
jgi:hypothetical protein